MSGSIMYSIRFKTSTKELAKDADTEKEFKPGIDVVKMFCHIYSFHIDQCEPFWGDENEAASWLIQTGYSFTISRKMPPSLITLISPAISSFIHYVGFKIVKEHLEIVDECE